MDFSTLLLSAAVIGAAWWLFFRPDSPVTGTKVTYTDYETGKEKTVRKQTRAPQNKLEIEKPKDFEVTAEAESILHALENTNSNVFMTGKAGTGKSTLLKYFRTTTKKNLVVVAPTGIAAINVQGQTIHSFFGWGIGITPQKVRRVGFDRRQVFHQLEMLIIDEISMVRADLFDCIDQALRLNTGKPSLPFGGVQIVTIGDLYQLPPIVTNEEKPFFERRYDSPFFFSSAAYSGAKFHKFELNKVFRQKDEKFITALNAIREGEVTQDHIELLNATVSCDDMTLLENYVNVVTTNKIAKAINEQKMQALTSEPKTYQGSLFGTFKEKDAPTDIELTLKAGAKVMLLNNDKQSRWVNGDVVRVLETRPHSVLVEFDDDTVFDIEPHTWDTVKFVFDEEEQKIIPQKVGGFTQLPLKLAWAMTVHKAQGKTFDKVYIDLGAGAFAEGQTYVALSRCKSLEGLKLAGPLMKDDVFINPKVRDFMSFTQSSAPIQQNKPITESSRPPVKVAMSPSTKTDALKKEQFVLQAIRELRKGNYKGIHAVYSGFNDSFRAKFNEDPIKATEKLAKKGIIVIKPAQGGVILYDAKEYRRGAVK